MRVLVTGGAGYIGSHVVDALSVDGHHVAVLDDLSSGDRQRLESNVDLYIGSISDPGVVMSAIRGHEADAVIHVAAKKAVEESIKRPLFYYQQNVVGTYNLLEAVAGSGVKQFLFSSSAAVYGEVEEGPVTESTETHPASPYGTTKLICEEMIRDAAVAHGFNWSALRYFNVAGAASAVLADRGESNLIPKLFRALRTATRPMVFGDDYATPDGTCVRDYIHVQDVADAHVDLLNFMGENAVNRVLNIGTGEGASVLEVIDAVRKVSSSEFQHTIADRRPGDPAEVVADPSAIADLIGWRARRTLQEAVESAWEATR